MSWFTKLVILVVMVCFSVPAFAQKEGKGKRKNVGKRIEKMHKKHVKKKKGGKHKGHDHAEGDHKGHDHAKGDHKGHDHAKGDHAGHGHGKGKLSKAERKAKMKGMMKGKTAEQKRAHHLNRENRKHSKRLAKINRIKQIAAEQKNEKLSAKVETLLKKENARHSSRIGKIKTKTFKGEERSLKGAPTPTPTPTTKPTIK